MKPAERLMVLVGVIIVISLLITMGIGISLTLRGN